ncbi:MULTISPECIES: CRISPR-associated endoribonuclease Cas6 [unclassified Streptomyces]|uniref:CRISPR-associated endoribonuclease Cas6 n=1 Tax=unclassified Streptomyces TaxID=2593676 RepID=UPI001C614F60|nr:MULTISPECIES: CRISPR-associated endoribonuclease Cas6 [unclassified Streptomyces]
MLSVSTTASAIPWSGVLAPGRSLVYDVLGRNAAELGRRLHGDGWGPHGMMPFGHSAPVFPRARKARGSYAAGGQGTIEFGSPLLEIVEPLAQGLAGRELLDWGGVALRLTGLRAMEPPSFSSGRAVFRTTTPVVVKGSGHDENGERVTRQEWLLPGDPGWPVYVQRNLERKAETLGLKPDVQVESVGWVGPKRSFAVGQGKKPGCAVEVAVSGDPELLGALWSWGLGQANSAGFGWIGA